MCLQEEKELMAAILGDKVLHAPFHSQNFPGLRNKSVNPRSYDSGYPWGRDNDWQEHNGDTGVLGMFWVLEGFLMYPYVLVIQVYTLKLIKPYTCDLSILLFECYTSIKSLHKVKNTTTNQKKVTLLDAKLEGNPDYYLTPGHIREA